MRVSTFSMRVYYIDHEGDVCLREFVNQSRSAVERLKEYYKGEYGAHMCGFMER